MSENHLPSLRRKILFTNLIVIGLLIGLEILFRVVVGFGLPDEAIRIQQYREMASPEMDPTIEVAPHPYVVYTFSPDLPEINEWGFTFSDDIPLERSPRTLRIVTLGGSTTAGPEAWPYHLGKLLTEHNPRKTVEILNFGTGGWTSAESMVAFATLGQSFNPDIVIVHHAVNDLDPLMRRDFRPDYAHFRKPIALSKDELGNLKIQNDWQFLLDAWGTRLSWLYTWGRIQISGTEPSMYTLHNLSIHPASQGMVPHNQVAENAKIFIRNLKTIGVLTESIRGKILFATLPYRKSNGPESPANAQNPWADMIEAQNQRVMNMAQQQRWPVATLHKSMATMDESHFEDQVHVDQFGEQLKAQHLLQVLQQYGMLN
jgi:lysophospholipase L1-like esterase